MWQSFVDLTHQLIPWFNGSLADVLIIIIKGLALIFPLIIMMASVAEDYVFVHTNQARKA